MTPVTTAGWVHVATRIIWLSDGAGAGIGLLRWRRLDRGVRWIAAWLMASAATDVMFAVTARFFHNNLLIGRLWCLASVTLALNGLAVMQHDPRRASLMRAVVYAYALTWAILLATVVRPNSDFSYIVELQALVVGSAAGATIVRRVAVGRGDLALDPAFLIGVALLAIAIPDGFLSPLTQFWARSNVAALAAFYVAKDFLDAVATLVLIRAMTLSRDPIEATVYA